MTIIPALQNMPQRLPAVLTSLAPPHCANPHCPEPPGLWQRWWARHGGIGLEGRWFCSANCFRAGVAAVLGQLGVTVFLTRPPSHRLPLGLLLLSQGRISEEQLRRALQEQRRAGCGKIGEWLVKLGALEPTDVLKALAVQQGCPVLADAAGLPLPAQVRFPLPLIGRHGAVPVYFNQSGKRLYLGFTGPVCHALLRATEHLLRLPVEACVIPEDLYRHAHAQWERSGKGEAVCLEARQANSEVAGMIASYAEQTEAEGCAIARCEEYFWVRLYGSAASLDLLFRG